MDIEGTSAIVTGGASGLGWAAAKRLSAAGALVTILDVNAQLAAERSAEIGGYWIRADVTSEEEIEQALAEAEARHGVARICVNCAGVGPPGRVIGRDGRPLPIAEFSRIVSINLVGSFNVLSRFAARLTAAEVVGEERGVIVNTASVAAFEGQIGQPAYAASKGGIVSMTLPIAREFARLGIRVMAVAPGLFMTPLVETLSADVQASLARQVPFPNRLGRPDEFAQLVQSIIENPMLNGETIRIDGALRMAPK